MLFGNETLLKKQRNIPKDDEEEREENKRGIRIPMLRPCTAAPLIERVRAHTRNDITQRGVE